ncbi:hypothetical protein BP5796_07082 [Coleophoma crateriformis]|uniref:Uncharacterized protein n=1 Tax=Coleophoma crateriformis TaxID=565419 RepID=A0A3D8RI46_9HELO|nr:hypothetical protein BP5796_07082 [Coleophoma crateriformis]
MSVTGRRHEDYSFIEALSLASREPLSLVTKEELGLPPTPRTPTDYKTPLSNSTTISLKPAPTVQTVPKSAKPPPISKMAVSSKTQAQCLDLCHKTTILGERISIRILEYLSTAKQIEHGFETLAHDFLDTCQILSSLEVGLRECANSSQSLPAEMITELDNKYRVTQANFRILDQMLARLLEQETGAMGRMRRGFGKLFGDTDIKKMTLALAKTRESLRMSALVFQWSLGSERIEREMGIGFTGLSAALNRMDEKTSTGRTKSVSANRNHRPAPLLSPVSLFDGSHAFRQQQQPPMPSLPWTERSSSIQRETTLVKAHDRDDPVLLSPDLGKYSATTIGTAVSLGSIERHDSRIADGFDRASTIDIRSQSSAADNDSLLDHIDGMEIGPSKVVRLKVDTLNMPRWAPRNTAGSQPENMKATLYSAVRGKNHQLVEQLLDRGVSPNTGRNMHALNEAVLVHDEESVRLLLLFGADPNEPDKDGITPLLMAVRRSFIAGGTALLKYGADPNFVAGTDLESPLAAAVIANVISFSHLLLIYNGDINHMTTEGDTLLISAINKKAPTKLIDLLLDYGSNPNAKSREGKTALFEAIQVRRADIVTTMLEHRADPNLPGPKHPLWPSTYHSACLQVMLSHGADHKKCPGIMELAASLNNIESVRILLKAGVNPNTKKDGVYTPLCTSIRDDRAELLQLLLSNGADPNCMASEYPAFKCVTHGRIHFLPALVAAGADLRTPKGILEEAVDSNNMEALVWLLDQGLNPNVKSPKGMTPLTTAIREDHIEMVDLLLQRGADPNVRGQDWPVCMAVRNPPILKRILSALAEPQAFKGVIERAVSADQLESVKLLIAAGVSVEDRNGGVFSPLTTAIREDRRAIVCYLLTDGGADVNAPGEHLPIVKALRRYHGADTQILELLLKSGADPNKVYRGWNAMMQAVENGDPDILRMLCRHAGVDLEAKDDQGRTVAEFAASRGWDEAVSILLDGRADA